MYSPLCLTFSFWTFRHVQNAKASTIFKLTFFCMFHKLWLTKHPISGLVAQAVRRSPPTAGVPSSHLGHSMWVSWWMKRGLCRFFSGFLLFFPYHKFHSTISPYSSHPFRFISSALVMVRQAWSAGTLATHGPIMYRGFIASHPLTWPCVGHELRIFYILFFKTSNYFFYI